MEKIGEVGGAILIDDYGHHPSEIEAVIRALRIRYSDRRLRIVFQPHRYTRTRDHAAAFARVLSTADEAFILPLYSSGEESIAGVDSNLVLSGMDGKGCLLDPLEIPWLIDTVAPNDIVLFQGAGDISLMARRALANRSTT